MARRARPRDEISAGEFTDWELQRRVVYSLLGPPVKLAGRVSMPLKEFGEWLEMAYFHDLRSRDFKMREISSHLQVSMRKVAQLSKALKENFFAPERGHGLPRRVEFALWAEPLSMARLQQALPNRESAEIEEALEVLLEQGRVEVQEGRVTTYAITRPADRLVRDDWMSRLDGLNQLLETVYGAVSARFFDDDERALARNLQLHVRSEDMAELRQLYEEVIWPRLRELDEAAEGDEERLPIHFALCWVPGDREEWNEQEEEMDDA